MVVNGVSIMNCSVGTKQQYDKQQLIESEVPTEQNT